jgi:hypothetical protein
MGNKYATLMYYFTQFGRSPRSLTDGRWISAIGHKRFEEDQAAD